MSHHHRQPRHREKPPLLSNDLNEPSERRTRGAIPHWARLCITAHRFPFPGEVLHIHFVAKPEKPDVLLGVAGHEQG